MLMIISPAKKLDLMPRDSKLDSSEIEFINEYKTVVNAIKKLNLEDLKEILSISTNLATQAYEKNSKLADNPNTKSAKQAIKLFKGDVYTGMQNGSLDPSDLEYLQTHLRIFSGVYGVLKPLDLIEPHRMEMGTNLMIDGKTLREFWKMHSFKAINSALKTAKSPVVNLASKEYFDSLDLELINSEVIDIIFKDLSKGKYKIISIYAKKARGMMVRYAVDNRITDAEELKNFDLDGYAFNRSVSSGKSWVFTREN